MTSSAPPDGWIDSPFRTKGVLFLGTRTFFESHHERGIEAVADQLPEGRLRAFLRQKFLAGGQYEVLVVPALVAAEARAMRQSQDDYLLQRTIWQAKQDIHGVYRLMLKLTSPETVVVRVPKVVTQMFNFGNTRSTMSGPKSADMEAQGIPAALVPWLSIAFKVYVETAVVLAGAKTCTLTAGRPLVEPSQSGFPMRTYRARLDWT